MKEDQGARSVFPRKSTRVKREADSPDASEQHDGNAAKARFARERGEGVVGVNSGGGTGGSEPYTAAAAAAAPGSMGEKRPNVAGFLAKAFQIFDNPAWSDVCGWGNNGETVVIKKQVEFAQRILPLYFNHSNLQSFVRQLNMYNFRKVVQDPNSGEFRHDLFRQGNGHLLHLIKRKQSATTPATSSVSRELSKMFSGAKHELEDGDARRQYAGGTEGSSASETAKMAGGIVKEADSVLEELVSLRQWQKEMETTVVELKRANQTLQSENQMLKGHMTEHANQQLVLQNKMQKILYCMYDVYMTGLRGANGTQSAAIREITELADSKGDNGSGDSDGGEPVKNLADAAAAGSALDGALAQLAALGGESIPGRLNLLDMENPWASGSGSDPVSGGSGDAKSRSPSSGSSGTNGILGGGALRRNRTWSQSSYEWLRSLRDPDPLRFVAPESASPVASPAAAAAAAAAAGTTSAAGTTTSLPKTISTSAAPTVTSEAGDTVAAADGDGGSSARTFTANPWARSAATATPERSGPVTKRQRRCADSVASSSDSVDVDVDVNGPVNKGDHSGGGEGEAVHRAPSFQPNAPILGDSDEGCGGHDNRLELGSNREEEDEGGNRFSAEDQVWGGGALSRALSEGANQVVSELGELGHREGEALSKIDSLGYQLANLLDASEPILGLDDVSVFDDGSGPLGLVGGASGFPSVSLSGGASGDGRAGSADMVLSEVCGSPEGVKGAMATVNTPSDTNFNSISAIDGLVPLAHSEGPAPAAARVRDAGAADSEGVGDGRVATLPGSPATFPDVVVDPDPGVDALDNGGSSSDGTSTGVLGGEDIQVDIKVEAGTELMGSVRMDGEASASGDNVNAVAIAEEDGGSRDKATTSSSMQAPLEISGMKGAPLPVVGGETG